jgi:hypothetical protein
MALTLALSMVVVGTVVAALISYATFLASVTARPMATFALRWKPCCTCPQKEMEIVHADQTTQT